MNVFFTENNKGYYLKVYFSNEHNITMHGGAGWVTKPEFVSHIMCVLNQNNDFSQRGTIHPLILS